MTLKRATKSELCSEPEPERGSVSAGQSTGRDEAADLRARIEALETANTELQCLADYRSEFLARLAHELRNPLTSILGFAEIVLNHEKLTTAQEDSCRRIQNSARQIEASLSQLSDLARLEAGPATLSFEEFSLADVLRESCRAQERAGRSHNVQLRCQVESGPAEIISDRSKIRQVLYNFLACAISRSPDEAAVTVTLEKRGADFRLKIEDEGERLSESSEMLLSTHPLWKDPKVATGQLGLAIARKLIEVLGAKLNTENRRPRGLMVTIQFPVRPPNPEDHT